MDTPSPVSWLAAGARAYADWLAGITWKRFFLVSVLALVASGILSNLPPFNLRWGPDRTEARRAVHRSASGEATSYQITIDDRGVRILPSVPASAASDAVAAAPMDRPRVDIKLPPGAGSDEIRAAIEDASRDITEAIGERDGVVVVRAFRLGDHLMGFTMVLILLSSIVKVMGAGRQRAEVRAQAATEQADREALKRQVVEARMAAMQAQVEPHFLFNTLASIDHLIETDAPRASRMQKNLIALLRASMPTMREANAGAPRELGRELEVIRPYLEILKVRMEDRLRTEIAVPEGLLSAQFPPMVLQGLVENAIKHGLEPKPEGGLLSVRADVEHGMLAVRVADTGLGFGKAATAGTGVGLANIRERLQLLYAGKAKLQVNENRPSGSVVTVVVPYQARSTIEP